jgi:hypothetical protein
MTADEQSAVARQTVQQFFDRPTPATPADARPDGKRLFPNVPCIGLDGACVGDLGHAGECAAVTS